MDIDNNRKIDPSTQISPQNSSSQNNPPINQKGIFLPILGIILLLIIIGGGVYYLRMQNAKQTTIGQQNNPIPSIATTTQPTALTTIEQKYSSTQCSLTLSYPTGWKAVEPTYEQSQDYQYVCVDIQASNYKLAEGGYTGTQIHITRTKVGTIFTRSENEKYTVNSIDDLIKILEAHPYSKGKVQNRQTKTLFGVEGIYYELDGSSFSLIKNGHIYSINWPKNDSNNDTTQQIINSIKF